MQIYLGLETCDAGWRIMRRQQVLAQHDKFLSYQVLPILHDKLRFAMTEKRGSWVTCVTDLRVMPEKHDKRAFFQTQTYLHLMEDNFCVRSGQPTWKNWIDGIIISDWEQEAQLVEVVFVSVVERVCDVSSFSFITLSRK